MCENYHNRIVTNYIKKLKEYKIALSHFCHFVIGISINNQKSIFTTSIKLINYINK